MENHLPSEDGEALSLSNERRTDEFTASGKAPLHLPPPLSPQWFAVYTSTHHEKHVCDALQGNEIEAFLPLYEVSRRWQKSRAVTLQLPLFPNYLFVRLTRPERGRVLGVPGVLSIVGTGRESWPIPDLEIETLRSALQVRNFEPHPYLAIGERVLVKAGPLAGMKGILARKKNSLRVVLSLEAIMKSTAVEVNAEDIEPVGSEANRLKAA